MSTQKNKSDYEIVKDVFTNGYNKMIMLLHLANHDLQPVIDQYACAQYVLSLIHI